MGVHELTAIQRDLLFVIRGLDEASGQDVKAELERTQGRSVLSGRIYTNLDELVEEGFVHKGIKNGRTNEYTLTEKGRKEILNQLRWQKRYVRQLA
jgi:DNA-binding PadR family transcriptional regulator